MRKKQRAQRGESGQLREGAGGEIAHDEDRQHDLVGRKAEEEGEQDEAIEPEDARQGVERAGADGKHARAARVRVGEHPDDEARGRRDDDRAEEDEQRPVGDRADDHLAELRRAVGGKLEDKGRGQAPQHRLGQKL